MRMEWDNCAACFCFFCVQAMCDTVHSTLQVVNVSLLNMLKRLQVVTVCQSCYLPGFICSLFTVHLILGTKSDEPGTSSTWQVRAAFHGLFAEDWISKIVLVNTDVKQYGLQVFVSSLLLLSRTIMVSNNCGTVSTLFKIIAIQCMPWQVLSDYPAARVWTANRIYINRETTLGHMNKSTLHRIALNTKLRT